MQQLFLSYINTEKLFISSDKILLTVSGGVDSIVMCELFHKSKLKFGIAHCNFQLRGKESDEDEKFVKQLAVKYNVPFYCKRFNTKEYVAQNNVSIQMAARELRYQWFEEIRNNEKYKYIATAHHTDDAIETFFINLIRGTGIAGLHGIVPKQGNIIRPLLFASKNKIEEYATTNKLKYREDSSNASDKYVRNKIRHHLIPLLKEINPAVENAINATIERLSEVEIIYKNEIEKQRTQLLKNENKTYSISIKELKMLNVMPTYLYEFLKPFNFNADTVKEISTALDGESGKQFLSPTHRLVKDRETLIIEEYVGLGVKDLRIKIKIERNKKKLVVENLHFTFKIQNTKYIIPKSKTTACLDYDKLQFPLEIRKWQQGDTFYPLNMKGKKKLSDFFIDNKLPLNRKENVWLLTSAGKIVWVIGMRIDNRFKVTDQTTKIYFAELMN